MCRVVVGQACSNTSAIWPAVIDPPSKFSVSRILRRAGWASAVNTTSYASIRAFGSLPVLPLAMLPSYLAHWLSIVQRNLARRLNINHKVTGNDVPDVERMWRNPIGSCVQSKFMNKNLSLGPPIDTMLDRLYAQSAGQKEALASYFSARAEAGDIDWNAFDERANQFLSDKLVALDR